MACHSDVAPTKVQTPASLTLAEARCQVHREPLDGCVSCGLTAEVRRLRAACFNLAGWLGRAIKEHNPSYPTVSCHCETCVDGGEEINAAVQDLGIAFDPAGGLEGVR